MKTQFASLRKSIQYVGIVAITALLVGCVIHYADSKPIGRPLTGPKTPPAEIATYVTEAAPAPECTRLVGTVSGEAAHAFVNRLTLERHSTEILKEESSKLGANAVVIGSQQYTGIYMPGGTHINAVGVLLLEAAGIDSVPAGVLKDRVAATGIAILVDFACAETKPLVNLTTKK